MQKPRPRKTGNRLHVRYSLVQADQTRARATSTKRNPKSLFTGMLALKCPPPEARRLRKLVSHLQGRVLHRNRSWHGTTTERDTATLQQTTNDTMHLSFSMESADQPLSVIKAHCRCPLRNYAHPRTPRIPEQKYIITTTRIPSAPDTATLEQDTIETIRTHVIFVDIC